MWLSRVEPMVTHVVEAEGGPPKRLHLPLKGSDSSSPIANVVCYLHGSGGR